MWLSCCRLALVLMNWSRFEGVENLWWVFPVGIRMDTIVLCELFALPAAILLLFPGRKIREALTAVLLTLSAALLMHMELSTPSFIEQFDNRPDRIYFEYLLYPNEVLHTLLRTYPLQLVVVAALVVLSSIWYWRLIRRRLNAAAAWPWAHRALVFPAIAILLLLGARSSLGHRPANLSTAAFSNHHLVNELAVNSTYSLFSAIYMTLKEVSAAKMYGDMAWTEVLARVKAGTLQSQDAFSSADIPTLHRSSPQQSLDAPTNIVVIVMESLGADFVGSLGGLPLTPHIDRLASEGLWFTQLYATGTRTVRGLEAIVTGFPPTAAPSVLKLPASQRNFFTIAQLLKTRGYATEFIYGGVSNFDNMGRFFRDNGFDRIIEQKDFKQPAMLGTWGVSDEDLILKAHQTFLEHDERPFFSLLLTTSNHVPFEFPANSIELHELPAATRNNAVKYTDHAIGKFFELARTAPYFERTLFLIVADHDARVFGADLVPVDRFRIPGLIIGPGVPKRHEQRIASQIDLAPTLLSLAGIDAFHPMIGRDFTSLPIDEPGRAMMQYANANGFRVGNKVVIHQPGSAAQTFNYVDGQLEKAEHDVELEREALAHLLWADRTYRQRLYRLPMQSSE
jgi:phosphoglycerol transferase MdoB-like AlkP superfamily enzyme